MMYSDMNIDSTLVEALTNMRITEPTEVQERVIPVFKGTRRHMLVQAKTGTGKTLAFAIPLSELVNEKRRVVQAVIIVPTRELCKQVASVLRKLTRFRKTKIVEIYGGVGYNPQIQSIRDGAQIVIATPGRLIDLYDKDVLSFRDVEYVVLDEADRMLDMGFFPDIKYVLLQGMRGLHPRQLLFSATLLESIKELVDQFTRGEQVTEIDVSHDSLTVENCEQQFYMVRSHRMKYQDFRQIVKQENPFSSIIFVNTKHHANALYQRIRKDQGLGLKVAVLEGNMSQKKREHVFKMFQKERINTLVATNVAARGLDFPQVSHVFNYDMPMTEEEYVHRVGRTSRMEHRGTAIALVLEREYAMIGRIERFIDRDITEMTLPNRDGRREQRYEPRRYGPRHTH